jgi:tyrosine-protein phosphatase
MAAIVNQSANVTLRKRSISDKESPTFALNSPLLKKLDCTFQSSSTSPSTASPRTPRSTTLFAANYRIDKPLRKPYKNFSMDSQNSPLAAPIPTFLSVYDSNSSRSSLDDVSQPFGQKLTSNHAIFSPVDASFNPFHQARHSTSTSASDSVESSPTTSASLDSASVSDSSPGPSPQSPSSMNFAMDASRFTPIEKPLDGLGLQLPSRPSPPASRKGRNMKNLAVNTTAAYNLGRPFPTAPMKSEQTEKQVSAPTSPLFLKPPTPPRRKMGNISLTIVTPITTNAPSIVPPTPSFKRPGALRHFQSSPSLPLLTSGLGPAGGMKLPSIVPQPAARGFAEIPQGIEEEDEEPNFDIPQSRDEAPETYPVGPVRIYESGIDLYYEPSVEVASRYDVIFNVASEVKNPFDVAEALAKSTLSPSTNVGILAEQPENAGSPTTPKATPISPDLALPLPGLPLKRPEYIHMLWEHNTDIVQDLYRLVKIMDDRVKEGKKILVHCQCGVSRSASLIIAYGLYKNPDMSVQEAYDSVKKRSKWIGPNMSLIMGLQEFRSNVERMTNPEAFALKHSQTLPNLPESFSMKIPSAPSTPTVTSKEQEIQPLQPGAFGPFSAAPVETTSASIWDALLPPPTKKAVQLSLPGTSVKSNVPFVDPKGHVVPVTTIVEVEQKPAPQLIANPTAQQQPTSKPPNFTRPLPFRRDYDQDTPMPDAPPIETESMPEPEELLSPRATEFHMSPLVPSPQVASNDTFHLFSPQITEFSQSPSFINQRQLSPPPPKRVAPAPPVMPRIEPRMESLNSIFSPTTTGFPTLSPLQPLSFSTDSSKLAAAQSVVRNDSLVPPTSPPLLAPPPPARSLRSKFSAPNLSQCIQLQRMQNDIASKLPKRPAEAEEALMSPRVTNFLANPFNMMSSVGSIGSNSSIASDEERESAISGGLVTPKKVSDPRSPPQFGLSPITRNIGDMI